MRFREIGKERSSITQMRRALELASPLTIFADEAAALAETDEEVERE